MKCDLCGNKEATVFLTQFVEGTMHKVNLCEDCAKQKGVNDPTGYALAEMLHGIGSEKALEASSAQKTRCPSCGFTLADLKKTGRLGCPDCYRIFATHLEPMLQNMHKGLQHLGKKPHAAPERISRQATLETLRASLAEAVAGEQYERAAALRDQIRSLENSPED